MSSIFTKIINGEIPSYKLYEDDKVFVILDIFPLQIGHSLVISKSETDNWLDLLPQDYIAIQLVAQKIGSAISKSISEIQGFERIGQMVDGRAVPHFHLHLIPLFEGQEITHNTQIRKSFLPEEFATIQQKIIANL